MDDPLRDVLYHYYTARASVYDAGYAGTPQPWVRTMVDALQTALADRHVLELACGTGHWTGYAAQSPGRSPPPISPLQCWHVPATSCMHTAMSPSSPGMPII